MAVQNQGGCITSDTWQFFPIFINYYSYLLKFYYVRLQPPNVIHGPIYFIRVNFHFLRICSLSGVLLPEDTGQTRVSQHGNTSDNKLKSIVSQANFTLLRPGRILHNIRFSLVSLPSNLKQVANFPAYFPHPSHASIYYFSNLTAKIYHVYINISLY